MVDIFILLYLLYYSPSPKKPEGHPNCQAQLPLCKLEHAKLYLAQQRTQRDHDSRKPLLEAPFLESPTHKVLDG